MLYGTYAPIGAVDSEAKRSTLPNGVYSWHSNPISGYDPLRDRVVQGLVSEYGDIFLGVHDRRSGTKTKVNLGRFGVDDHNAPAFLMEDDKPPIAAIVQHAVEAFVRVRIGSAPHDYESLETATEQQVAFPDVCTYAHEMRKTATNTMLLGTRVGSTGWQKRITTDWGATWGPALPFHTSAYATFRKVGKYVHYTTYSHPITTPNNTIRYFRIDLDTGVCTNAAGTVIGNVFTDTTAIPAASMTMVRQSYDTDAGHNSDRVFDIAPDGSIAAMQFDKNHPELGGVYGVYRFATTGATPNSSQSPDDPQRGWVFEPIVASGVPVGYYQSGYAGGGIFGSTSYETYWCRESAGTWTAERWVDPEQTANWVPAEVIAKRTDGTKLGRPRVPWGAEGKKFLGLVEYSYYPTNTFLGYFGDHTLLPTTALPPVADTTPPTVPGGRVATAGDQQVSLSWFASTDNVAVANYRIYQGLSLIDTVTGSSKTITGLTNGTEYDAFRIKAVDTSGNESEFGAFPAVTPVGPAQDPMLNIGTMVLIDPTNEFEAWPAGVPTTTVPNLARNQAWRSPVPVLHRTGTSPSRTPSRQLTVW